jgi:hypothetical protein
MKRTPDYKDFYFREAPKEKRKKMQDDTIYVTIP